MTNKTVAPLVPRSGSWARLTAGVHHRTDGHPLFMVTVVDALVQQHGLVERVGRWAVQGGVEKVALEVPESLQQLASSSSGNSALKTCACSSPAV